MISIDALDMCSFKLAVDEDVTVSQVVEQLFATHIFPRDLRSCVYFTRNGLSANEHDKVSPGDHLSTHLRLRGGKGGFGSMLRAIGSQIEKTTNMEACRDLSGRRMRDVNNEKKMMEWIKEKAEKDKKKEQEKIEKLERSLQRPKHFFNDPDYERKLEETSDNVEDATKEGLMALKRKNKDTKASSFHTEPKKSKMWGMGMDDVSSGSSDDSDNSDNEEIPVNTKIPIKNSSHDADAASCSTSYSQSKSAKNDIETEVQSTDTATNNGDISGTHESTEITNREGDGSLLSEKQIKDTKSADSSQETVASKEETN